MFDIIIVSYNAINNLKKCVDSVLQNTNAASYRLTIVDNNSSGRTKNYLKKISTSCNVISLKKNRGFSHAANVAIESTNNKFIALLDDDVVVTKKWLEKLQMHFINKKNIGLVTGKILYPDDSIFSVGQIPYSLTNMGHGEIDKGQHNLIRECDAIAGPCWLIKRKTFHEVGKFDEAFFPCQFEDTDYCIRLRALGYKIICDGTVKIYHDSLFRVAGVNNKNKNKFYKKWKALKKKPTFTNSSRINLLYTDGLRALAEKDFFSALKYFQTLNKIDTSLPSPFYLALSHQMTGNKKLALGFYKKTLRVYNPNFWKIRKKHYSHILKAIKNLSEI